VNNLVAAPTLTYKFPKLATPASIVLFLPLYAMAAGTGGAYQPSSFLDSHVLANNPLIRADGNRRRKSAVASIPSQIAKIRGAFRLNMSELADVFGVSRPTTYSWLQGATPKEEILEKIWRLGSYADKAAAMNIPRMEVFMKRPLGNGTTLMEALKSGREIEASLSHLQDLVRPPQVELSPLRQRTALKTNTRRVDEVSIPFTDRG
jgi:hypothetical protein